jgi:hypothetical protein
MISCGVFLLSLFVYLFFIYMFAMEEPADRYLDGVYGPTGLRTLLTYFISSYAGITGQDVFLIHMCSMIMTC